MGEKKLLIAFIIGTLLLLSGGVMILNNTTMSSKVTVTKNAKVEILEREFNWGQIDYSGPKATKTFIIKNSGSEVLKLTNVKTSCSCTSAQLVIDGIRSPLFLMHSTSSWVGQLQPGREAQVIVVFDQRFHGPQSVGPIERIISVETSDVNNPKIEFKLTGNVIKSS